jgi:hypothetical protein
MKQIIDGKLYDTDKMEKLYSENFPGPDFWKSKNGTILRRGYRALDSDYLQVVTEEYFKEYLATTNPDKYIELFGEVEEG